MAKTTHFKGFSIIAGDLRVKLSLSRFDEQYKKAQYQLDGDVMNSMVPFMPMISGSFINTTRAASAAVQGSGQVYAAYGPQGRYLYEGKVMVDEVTGSPFARKGAKKVLVSQYAGKTAAKENIDYTHQAHPKAQDHWFDAAKAADGKKWVRRVKATAGGGKRG
nr:MAG TPA: Minor capsid protein [Caudoviricetes sp.]